jgi:ubiquinone/menaquinone biosynthesis C-methylase UbiE
MTTVGAAFDRLASRYDELWTSSPNGRVQREAVWRRIDGLFRPGDRILDLGCGIGDDALHFMSRSVEVMGVDASAEMVRIARSRGVEAISSQLSALSRQLDGAISNFGMLNCVERLEPVAGNLARLIRPGGKLAICVIGRFCLRETVRYAARLEFSKAFRRLRPGGTMASFGVHVRYPSVPRIRRAFGRDFRLDRWYGIGLCSPNDAWERRLAHLPLLRALADHRLLIFHRV